MASRIGTPTQRSPRMRRQWRFSVVLALLLVCLLLASSVSAEEEEDVIPKIKSTDRIMLTMADGSQKEVTGAELEQMQRYQREMQVKLQKEKTETEWVEDEDLDDLARRDPSLARQIQVAREAFTVLQQHGYAQGYALASFVELDSVRISSPPKGAGKPELRITMQLTAKRDLNSKVKANPGTSASKRGAEPDVLQYETELLFDENQVASVVYAWQLTSDARRGKELSIKPSEALMARYAARRQQQTGSGSVVGEYATWLLAGGVTLIVVGVAMVFLASREPAGQPGAPAATAVSSASTTSPMATTKKPTTKTRKDVKSITKQEAGEGWELAN